MAGSENVAGTGYTLAEIGDGMLLQRPDGSSVVVFPFGIGPRHVRAVAEADIGVQRLWREEEQSLISGDLDHMLRMQAARTQQQVARGVAIFRAGEEMA